MRSGEEWYLVLHPLRLELLLRLSHSCDLRVGVDHVWDRIVVNVATCADRRWNQGWEERIRGRIRGGNSIVSETLRP